MIKFKISAHSLRFLQQFMRLEAASGILLLTAALLALIIDNSPLQSFYAAILNTPVVVHWGSLDFAEPVIAAINDGLMALFFLLVGLEIKREMLSGELDTFSKIVLPGSAALGGMLLPALLYILFNWLNPLALRGWAIPMATDIAFSLGILALCGRRIPLSLKVFLTALAIFDDLGAILVIAIFYSAGISWLALLGAVLCLVVLISFNRAGIKRLWPYLLVGCFLWAFVLKSGIHATLAGVALAFTIPMQVKNQQVSPLRHLEQVLHPWVAFAILPLFGFANAGISFTAISWQDWLSPITLGIIAGLVIGKQMGVLGGAWLTLKLGYANLPQGANWRGLYGVALLCGVGFTMSLFIGGLAFNGDAFAKYNELSRMGILAGSLISGVIGYVILRGSKQPY